MTVTQSKMMVTVYRTIHRSCPHPHMHLPPQQQHRHPQPANHQPQQLANQQLRFIWHPPKTRYATATTASTATIITATTALAATIITAATATTQDKKMDLGEAYMKAQQFKIESAAVTANTKTRTDLVIAMMVQNKSPEEITAILKLAGF
jgi:hypothetical protein